MQLSKIQILIMVLAIAVMVIFLIRLRHGQRIMLVHKCYYATAILLITWLLEIMAMTAVPPDNTWLLAVLDGLTTVSGAFIPACSLMFSLCYTREYNDRMPKWLWLIFIVPLITSVMVLTNPLHHLYYRTFALDITQVEFGPYFPIHSMYTYACVAVSVFIIIRFAIKTKSRLHIWQAVLFTVGSLAPSLVNLLVTLRFIGASIVTTPISFTVTMIFHGIVIYRLHFFDIRPVAMQQLLNWISDCYLVTASDGRVVNYNQPFLELFGRSYKIRENICLGDCVSDEDVENKTPVYNLLTALRSCERMASKVTYEQAVDTMEDGESRRFWYLVEVSPVAIKGTVGGYVSIFKDMTQIKQSMQKMQDNQLKMMENERLAFLGQMVGGLAHNLKTPIMSISGGILSIEKLITECRESLGDPDVTVEDYGEIYDEMGQWLSRMQEAGSYMSDIITAVKGQARNISTSEDLDFSLDDAVKRVMLLLRHELLDSQCTLKVDPKIQEHGIMIHGDINSLVQVINNLVSNAIDAQKPDGNRDIVIDTRWDEKEFCLTVTDFGTGIPEQSKRNLFHQMVTSKGTRGTGLGVYISNSVIHAKFGGSMWYEDNPLGGTIMGVCLPPECVSFTPKSEVGEIEKE